MFLVFFFFNDTATTEIYTLSLHDALPIYGRRLHDHRELAQRKGHQREPWHRVRPLHDGDLCLHHGRADGGGLERRHRGLAVHRSEEHTSELQSRQYLVCRLLLEKKKNNYL